MKKLLFILATFICCVANAQTDETLRVFISDNDGAYTNVRNKPSGKVVDRIPTDASAMLNVETPKNGWWRVTDDTYCAILDGDFEDVMLKGSTTGYWVHYSCIGCSTRNYGGQHLKLRSEPKADARVVYTIKEETTVRPVEIKDGWVKVKTLDGKGFGWIEAEWLCGNSVTTCC